MPVPLSKPCATCAKPCYPTERVMISDLTVHKNGCLKCSVCFTTLSLSSVYVAPAPCSDGAKQLYCAKDVPKTVHANVVDSLALRAALNAPNPTTTPSGVFASVKGKTVSAGKSIRFKGLTLRSRAIKAGLEAPKLDLRGLMRTRGVVGNAPGSPLDSWDIVHAMNVQSNVSSPIRDHPAIHAQRTGSSVYAASMPSQPLVPDLTGGTDHAKAGKDEESVIVEPDLVKNLIKVFQLESVSSVAIDLPPTAVEASPSTLKAKAGGKTPTANPYFDDVFSASSGTMTLTKHTRDAIDSGSVRTLATLGTNPRSRSRSNTQGRDSHVQTRSALLDIFNWTPAPPPPTPAKIRESSEDDDDGLPTLEEGRKAMALLRALLPMAAHLIPLPGFEGDEGLGDHDDEGDEDGGDAADCVGAEEESLAAVEKVIDEGEAVDQAVQQAREDLVRGLEEGELELIMLFEELPEAEGVVLERP